MKKIVALSILLSLLATLPLWAAITYFGEVNSSTGALSWTPQYAQGTYLLWQTETCPLSGSQSILTVGAWAQGSGGTTGTVRVGIYDATGTTLIVDGGNVAIGVSDVAQWYDATVTATCTGGTQYILAEALGPGSGASGTVFSYDGASASMTTSSYKAGDYSAGLPSSLPTPDGTGQMARGLRASTQPGGGATTSKTLPTLGAGE